MKKYYLQSLLSVEIGRIFTYILQSSINQRQKYNREITSGRLKRSFIKGTVDITIQLFG